MAKCEMCLAVDPVWNCEDCNSSKCAECDEKYHKPVRRSNHRRTPLQPFDQNVPVITANEVMASSNAAVNLAPFLQSPSVSTVNPTTKPIDLSFIKQGVNPGLSPATPVGMLTGYDFGNNMRNYSVPSSVSKFPVSPATNTTVNQVYPHHQGPSVTPTGANAVRFSTPGYDYMQGGDGVRPITNALDSTAFFGSNIASNNVGPQTVSSPRSQSTMPNTSNVPSTFPYSNNLPFPTRPEMPPSMSQFPFHNQVNAMNGIFPRFQGPNTMYPGQQPFQYQNPSYPMNASVQMPSNLQHPLGNQFRMSGAMGAGYTMGAPMMPAVFGDYQPYMHAYNWPYNCGQALDEMQPSSVVETAHKEPEDKENEESKEVQNEEIAEKCENEDATVDSSDCEEEMPKFCVKCGSSLCEGFNFCAKCGQPVVRIKKLGTDFSSAKDSSTRDAKENAPRSDKRKQIPKLSMEMSGFEKSCDNDTKSQKAEDGSDSFYTPVPSPVDKSANISFNSNEADVVVVVDSKEKHQIAQNKILNESQDQQLRTQPNLNNDGAEYEDMLVDGLSTFTFVKSKLLNGQDLNDLELLLSSGKFSSSECNEDDMRAIIEDDLSTVNDVFGPLLKDKLGGCDTMKFASEVERQIALEATAFDSIKSSTLLVNWRKYLLECFLDDGLNADDFHNAMLQCQGDVRKAAAELQIGLINENNQRHIWNTNENENALDVASRNNSFDCLSAKTMTDTLLEEAISSYCSLPLKEKEIKQKQMFSRKVMAEKKLNYARAHLMISMLDSNKNIDYISAYLTAKNLTDQNVLVPKGYKDYFKECVTCCDNVVQDFIIKFPNCASDCSVCVNCVKEHFNAQIYGSGKQVGNILCPGCNEKILTGASNEIVLVQLENVLSPELFSMFETRALENCLENDKNFRWCAHDDCEVGFIWENNNVLRMQCTNGHLTCFKCGRKWKEQHENATCEEFSRWELENDPAYQNRKLDGFLRAMDAMICPECNYRYELVRGGCLHFICFRCKAEFCGFCYARFSRECRRFERCQNLGFHAHCPRFVFSIRAFSYV